MLLEIIELETVNEKEEGILALTRSYKNQGLIISVNGLKETLRTIIKSSINSTINEAKERAIGEEVRNPKIYNK